MSYVRGRYYVWADDEKMHLWVWREKDAEAENKHVEGCEFAAGVAIPLSVFDEIVRRRSERSNFGTKPFDESQLQ